MGVAKTLPNYKSFTFGGTNSKDYGVYITGQGVFNAPERNVEMVEIPGRNGSYALDKGNFNNIEVTYPAGIFADNETDFAQAVSDLRNLLCSKVGYVRLEDDYNPNEYRLAVYKSGLEVSHDMLIAGEFDIVFECKPQRFLTSGETAVAVASGGTLTNPTLFPSRPQLQVWGYGNIGIGGETISVTNTPIGNVQIAPSGTYYDSYTQTLDVSMLNSGDTITVSSAEFGADYVPMWGHNLNAVVVQSTTNCSATASGYYGVVLTANASFSKGTSNTATCSATANVIVDYVNITPVTISCSIAYNGSDSIVYSMTATSVTNTDSYCFPKAPIVFANSTKSALGSPLYIDLDTGECYNMDYGYAVSSNNSVTMPTELPTLASGNNTITYDNTITSFKVLPRWWKV